MDYWMKSTITLVAAMLLAVPAIATEDEHAGHHPDQGEAAAAPVPDQRLQEMQARMQEIRGTTDPEARMRLMGEQMTAMESMMEHMGGMGQDGMGPGMMQHGPGGMGPGMMHQGPGGGMDPAMMQQRHEMMQRCMEMMQRDMGPPGTYRGDEGR